MKNQQFHKLLKRKAKNSGFTLFELLTGLVMSIFVTGALGFGLYQVLKITSEESSKISARNEATRAIEFISDEIRRARTIDGDLLADVDEDGTEDNTAQNFSNPSNDKIVVLALDIPEINDGDTFDTDNDDTTPERIVYYLKSSTGTDWQGPLVLYRWGPPLNANGQYTNGTWQEEALIDGIDDTVISNACNSVGGTQTPATAKGFYACISGEKTAQLFLTSGIYADKGEANSNNPSETYTTDTKVAARAKVASVDSEEGDEIPSTDFKTLKADYDCTERKIQIVTEDRGESKTVDKYVPFPWTIRLDFNSNDLSSIDSNNDGNIDSTELLEAEPDQIAAYNDTTPWLHKPNRKPQPINVSTSDNLTITVSAVGELGCDSRGNEGKDGTEKLGEYDASKDVNYTLRLKNPSGLDPKDQPNWYSFNGYDKYEGYDEDGKPIPKDKPYDNPDVNGDGSVLVLKEGSILTKDLNPSGHKGSQSGKQQDSLGKFLADEGYATDNKDGSYTITGLEPNERILAFELGHTEKYLNNDPTQPNPGFDVNDAIFIMTNEKFADEN